MWINTDSFLLFAVFVTGHSHDSKFRKFKDKVADLTGHTFCEVRSASVTSDFEIYMKQALIDMVISSGKLLSDDLCIVQEEKVVFQLMTPEAFAKSGESFFEVRVGEEEKLFETTFDPSRPTEIYVHGWLENSMVVSKLATKMYFGKANLNINLFIMDWDNFSSCEYSHEVNVVVPTLGPHLARFIEGLQHLGAQPENIRLVGFSLGAHIVGFAGKHLKQKPARITGLDPAGPGFCYAEPDKRLNATDAEFVNVIHTSMDFYGTSAQSGHADWYVNSGSNQPGCFGVNLCNHVRSFLYYLESLYTTTKFYGTSCNSYEEWQHGECVSNDREEMGYYTSKDSRGKYYVDTNANYPFAMSCDTEE